MSTKRVRTPTLIQMEAVECGAAALGIILGYYGAFVPLEELRSACGVSRNGVNALNIVKAARSYDLTAQGKQVHNTDDLKKYRLPFIAYWNFNHFLVVEGFGKNKVYLNDPAMGPRTVSSEEFDQSYTGIVLVFEPAPEFKKRAGKKNIFQALVSRLSGSRQDVAFVLLVSLFLTVTGVVIPTFSKIFVDNILVAKQNLFGVLLIGMILTAILRAVFSWMQKLYLLRLETKLAITSSSKFLWHVLRLPSEFFAQRFAGDISHRVEINDKLARMLSEDIASSLLSVVVIFFYVILMLRYDVVLTLVSILIAVLNLIAFRYVSRRRVDASIKLQQEQGKLQGVVMNGLQIIETLKSSATESNFFIYYGGHQAKALDASQEMGMVSAIIQSVPPFLTALNTAAILVIGGVRVMDGVMTIGTLVAFQSLMASFIAPFNQLVTLAGSFQEVSAENDRLNDILQYPVDPQLNETTSVDEKQNRQAKLSGYLELKQVSFGYSKLEPALIDGFDLSLKPGDRIALVGASGSGKSTVAKVVSGLYAPWSGEILFDGQHRLQIERSIVTNSVAMVDQDIFLFEGSVRDNLTMWDRTVPESDIIQAAKDACIHEEISRRQRGYDSVIDEGGRNFSGGQRQRIEIARALVANPSILILDEATSALDPIEEKTIFNNIRRRGCTCLVIAHRLSTIRDCDEIIVLEQGKIVERGIHDQLYGKGGVYTQLVGSESYQSEKSMMQSILEKL